MPLCSGKPGKLEKSFELSVVDDGRFNAVTAKQSARDLVIELDILLQIIPIRR